MGCGSVLFDEGVSAMTMKEMDSGEPLTEMVLRLCLCQAEIVLIKEIRIEPEPLVR